MNTSMGLVGLAVNVGFGISVIGNIRATGAVSADDQNYVAMALLNSRRLACRHRSRKAMINIAKMMTIAGK